MSYQLHLTEALTCLGTEPPGQTAGINLVQQLLLYLLIWCWNRLLWLIDEPEQCLKVF